MNDKLVKTLRSVNMLYVIEEDINRDYHLMPFRLICDHISLSDFERAWDIYMAVKPSIILIHFMEDIHRVTEFVKKVRQFNSKCTIVILTEQAFEKKIHADLGNDIQKLLIDPVNFEELMVSLDSAIDYSNLYYHLSETFLFEPHNSAFIINDRRVCLTKKETELISLLLQNRHRIVTYREIEHHIWANESMSLNSLTSIVRNIRKKAEHNDVIKNYSGQGYQIGTL